MTNVTLHLAISKIMVTQIKSETVVLSTLLTWIRANNTFEAKLASTWVTLSMLVVLDSVSMLANTCGLEHLEVIYGALPNLPTSKGFAAGSR